MRSEVVDEFGRGRGKGLRRGRNGSIGGKRKEKGDEVVSSSLVRRDASTRSM